MYYLDALAYMTDNLLKHFAYDVGPEYVSLSKGHCTHSTTVV